MAEFIPLDDIKAAGYLIDPSNWRSGETHYYLPDWDPKPIIRITIWDYGNGLVTTTTGFVGSLQFKLKNEQDFLIFNTIVIPRHSELV